MFSLQVPRHIWNFIRHNQFRISHWFNIYWAPTKPIYTLSHMPALMPSGLIFQWRKTQTGGMGAHVLLRITSTSERRCVARVFLKYFSFPPKGINFIICLFDLKSRWICTQSKQNMGTLGPWQKAKNSAALLRPTAWLKSLDL